MWWLPRHWKLIQHHLQECQHSHWGGQWCHRPPGAETKTWALDKIESGWVGWGRNKLLYDVDLPTYFQYRALVIDFELGRLQTGLLTSSAKCWMVKVDPRLSSRQEDPWNRCFSRVQISSDWTLNTSSEVDNVSGNEDMKQMWAYENRSGNMKWSWNTRMAVGNWNRSTHENES